MRVLVTGGRGFLGRHLMPLLAKHDVMSVVHRSGASEPLNGVREVVGDLGCEGSWRSEVERFAPDWCIHLA